MKDKFEGIITIEGHIIYCKQGEHLRGIPFGCHDFIKFTSYNRGLVVCEGEGYYTQAQLDALWDVCKKHGRLDLFRRFNKNIENLLKESENG